MESDSTKLVSSRIVGKQYAVACFGTLCQETFDARQKHDDETLFPALLMFEYVLTLGREVDAIWSRRRNLVTLLWVCVSRMFSLPI